MAKWQAQGKYPGIFQDAEDGRHWRVVVNLGRVDGGPRRRAVKVLHGTLSDARAAHTALLGQKQSGKLRPEKSTTPGTVGGWVRYYLDTYKRPGTGKVKRGVSRSTFERYENELNLYIEPYQISRVPLKRLDAGHVQEYVNALAESGISPGTIFQTFALLKRALNRAVALGKMPSNPCGEEGVEKPKRPGRRRLRIPTDDELRALLKVMSEGEASVYPLVRAALATGMREGELIALEWSSVDLGSGNIHVCRSASRVPAGPDAARYHEYEFKRPKTEASIRDVPVDPATLAWLKDWRKTITEQKLLMRPRRWTDEDGDLVFPQLTVFAGSLAGRAWQQGTLRKAFYRYAERAGLGDLHFHDLRHIYGAVLHRNGVPLMTISRLMGHSSIKTTADLYGHIDEAQKRDAAAVMGDVLG